MLIGRTTLCASLSDLTVSRRHLSLNLCRHENDPDEEETSLSFMVLGKNPIWVFSQSGEIKTVYKKSEKGVLRVGDKFSLSLKKPFFFTLRRREGERETYGGNCGGTKGLRFDSMDVSAINPVKEFNFLVRGHEFDHYPRHKIQDFTDWNWFLEEPNECSDSDDDTGDKLLMRNKGKRKNTRKKRLDDGNEKDEDWTGESEDDKLNPLRLKSAKRPRYITRSKDQHKPPNGIFNGRQSRPLKIDTDDDDEEETLGSFIVNEEEVEEEEEDDEAEEEFTDDDDDDDDDDDVND
ncbi:hypothetical protein QJS10_CPB22g00770 [Acorus calamus]|uniref:Uncharacterized protein n=1 Tax=Acorus calamus TaxID=4465 RepID=A0AAV9C1M1_ACOCL|nr:hypothetical protein QJS10_CPB22g00770 [Acorus calamus]